MAKHPPFDAVPALSYGVWVREKAWVQMLQKTNVAASHVSPPRDSVRSNFYIFFNRKLSGRLLSTVNFYFFLIFFLPSPVLLAHRPPLPARSFQ